MIIGLLAVLVIWFYEYKFELVSQFDLFAYPAMIVLLLFETLLLFKASPQLHTIKAVCFSGVVCYLVGNTWYVLLYATLADGYSIYYVATLMSWLPLLYVIAFVFYPVGVATGISAVVYILILLPEPALYFLTREGFKGETLALYLNLAVAHPVYIVAMFGISHIRDYAYRFKKQASVMTIAANLDTLTGAINRRGMVATLEKTRLRALERGRSFAVIMFDVDHFKRVNDNYGHEAGDHVLITIAGTVKNLLRKYDAFSRWGGEEFLILTPGLSHENALILGERIRASLERIDHTGIGTITVSVGVTTLIYEESITEILKRVDDAVYQAKSNGRNQVVGSSFENIAIEKEKKENIDEDIEDDVIDYTPGS